ncbi:hypothetical protein EBT31_12255 [bacterium]|jgi:DNA invertase Pin-like site-specific DNA recombinase|nr:hypothetical protein [bacterium]
MTTAIYARVSTESEDQAHALEQQLHRLRARAADLGEPVAEFIDVASGTRDDRPQLKRLLEACADGLLTTVLCTRLDRMSRSTVHGGKLMRLFTQPDWPNLICLDQPIDLASAAGRFYANMLMGMAQMESELIGERVHHGQMYARNKLKPQAGKPPFGYLYNTDKTNYVINAEQLPIAKQIVQKLIETGSIRDTFDFQMQQCGRPFRSLEGLRRWLMNPAIAGHRVYGTCRWEMDADGNKRRLINKPGQVDEIHPNAHPALISAQEEEEVHQVIESLKQRSLGPIRKRRHRLLTGLVRCGHCGGRMHYHVPRSGQTYVRCTHETCPVRPHRVLREQEVIDAAIQKLYERRELLAYNSVVEELRLKQQLSPEIKRLQTQIRDLKLLNDPDLLGVITQKQQRLTALLQGCMNNGASRWSVEEAMTALDQPELWNDLTRTPEHLRSLLSQWVEEIVITDGAVSCVRLRAGEQPTSSS